MSYDNKVPFLGEKAGGREKIKLSNPGGSLGGGEKAVLREAVKADLSGAH